MRSLKVYSFSVASRPGGPSVFVQAREVVSALELGQYEYWHRWYKHAGRPRAFSEFCARLGAAADDWRVGLKQAWALGYTEAQMEPLADEVVCSSTLLLGHLVDWSVRLQAKSRDLAKRVLADIFLKVVSTKFEGVPWGLWSPPDRAPGLCEQLPGDGEGSCLHCVALMQELPVGGTLPPQSMSALLVKAWESRRKCALVRQWAWGLARNFARVVDDCFGHASNWQASSASATALRAVTRRARLDKDMNRTAIRELIDAGRVKSAAQAARAGLVDASEGACKDVEDESMRGYFIQHHAGVPPRAHAQHMFR